MSNRQPSTKKQVLTRQTAKTIKRWYASDIVVAAQNAHNNNRNWAKNHTTRMGIEAIHVECIYTEFLVFLFLRREQWRELLDSYGNWKGEAEAIQWEIP